MSNPFATMGWIFVVFGVICYATATGRGWDELKGRSLLKKIGFVISHLPRDDTPAWPHVFGGTFLSGGIALLSGAAAYTFLDVGKHYALELASFVFALFVATIAFWTLWQTRRLDIRIGQEIDGFPDFIQKLTGDLEALRNGAYGSEKLSPTRFRFLLVTHNPYFGLLSLPGTKVTENFESAVLKVAGRVPHGFRMEIICADDEKLQEFHVGHFLGRGLEATVATERATLATKATKKFLNDLSEKSGSNSKSVRQTGSVPSVQFAIIGNRTYEFFLESAAGPTEVHRVQLVDERRTADRYVEFFDLLAKRL